MLNPIYVTDQILDNFLYQALKTLKPSSEKLKVKQKSHLIQFFNDLIDKGVSNPNITILGDTEESLGECISSYEENEVIYLLTYHEQTNYNVFLVNGGTFQILEKIEKEDYDFQREGSFSVLFIWDNLITVVTPFNIYVYQKETKKWKKNKMKEYEDYYNTKLVYHNEACYGMFDSQFFKLDFKTSTWDEISYTSENYPEYLMKYMFHSYDFVQYCPQVVHENW